MVTENIGGTIGYTDNNDYMRNNLIPVMGTVVDDFAMKNSLNGYTNNDICVYTNEYNACSLYEFTITNNANVTQELMVTLNPSKLESIGGDAFYHAGLLYETEDDPLYIPESVTSIGDNAFDGNPDWTGKIYFIRYKGSQSNLDALGTSWYAHRYTVDVKAIG